MFSQPLIFYSIDSFLLFILSGDIGNFNKSWNTPQQPSLPSSRPDQLLRDNDPVIRDNTDASLYNQFFGNWFKPKPWYNYTIILVFSHSMITHHNLCNVIKCDWIIIIIIIINGADSSKSGSRYKLIVFDRTKTVFMLESPVFVIMLWTMFFI